MPDSDKSSGPVNENVQSETKVPPEGAGQTDMPPSDQEDSGHPLDPDARQVSMSMTKEDLVEAAQSRLGMTEEDANKLNKQQLVDQINGHISGMKVGMKPDRRLEVPVDQQTALQEDDERDSRVEVTPEQQQDSDG